MTPETQSQPANDNAPAVANNDREKNFRRQEAMYQRMLAEKEARLAEVERQLQQQRQPAPRQDDDDDDDDDVYVDKKKLKKTLNNFQSKTQQMTQAQIQEAVAAELARREESDYINNNPDFYDTLEDHAETFSKTHPHLANSILRMPASFERHKLVYENIKALGIGKKQDKQTAQQKVDQKLQTPYYQPSNVGNQGYSKDADFSEAGKKKAYDHVQALKNRLKIG